MATDAFSFQIDLDEGFIKFDCGWYAQIYEMFDDEGDTTLEPSECVAFTVQLPEGELYVEISEAISTTMH